MGVAVMGCCLFAMRAWYFPCRAVNLEFRVLRDAVNARMCGSFHFPHRLSLLILFYSLSNLSRSSSIVRCFAGPTILYSDYKWITNAQNSSFGKSMHL